MTRTPRYRCFRDTSQTLSKVTPCEHDVNASLGVTLGCETSGHVGLHEGTIPSTCNVTWVRLPGQLDEPDSNPCAFTPRDHHQFTTSTLQGTNHVRVVAQSRPLLPFRIYVRGQSFTVLALPCFATLECNPSIHLQFTFNSSSLWPRLRPRGGGHGRHARSIELLGGWLRRRRGGHRRTATRTDGGLTAPQAQSLLV